MRGHRRLLADQRGFTMVSVMLTMMALGMFAVGAWSAAVGDIPIARGDQDHKRAYEAAQAGLEWYAYQLERDPAYWTQCASVPQINGTNAPVNLEGANPRVWRTLTASKAAFTLEILKKRDDAGNPTTACSTADPSGTALQDNTLRIRATGKANGDIRSLIGTFKRKGFMDYVYFTQWESQDPAVSGDTYATCNQRRTLRGNNCTEIMFGNNDGIRGPLHTNDESVLTCGTPTFGRPPAGGKTYNDPFETTGTTTHVTACGGSPTFNGPTITPAATMTMPPSNGSLATLATASWTYTGNTCLLFAGTSVKVYSGQNFSATGTVTCTGTPTTRPLTGAGSPPNGVIYVENGAGCSGAYELQQRYNNSATCGDVAVTGNYAASVTIGARNDIIVGTHALGGSLTRTGNYMMGLVATNLVRVYHPQDWTNGCANVLSSAAAVHQVDAAILSLTHSFMVDNYMCGAAMGNLTVNGAIAQYFRGTVATSNNGTIQTGYVKDYWYDDRLKYKEPPNFLDPVQTSWHMVRQTEQLPATKGP